MMRRNLAGHALMVTILCLGPLGVRAAMPAVGVSNLPERWVVGTSLSPPFVTRGDNGAYGGVAIELWQAMAESLGIETEYRAFDYDSAGMLLALERGELDIVVGNLAVNPDTERRIDFTHPYLRAELGIVTRSEPESGLLGTLGSLKVGQILLAILALMALLVTVGALVWIAERRRNSDEFNQRPMYGLADGLWWAAVTMTTTGYGDKAPRSFAGRSIALIWMFSSIFLTAIFSATLASALVVDRLKTRVAGPQDLPRVRVASVANSAGLPWLGQAGVATISFPFVIQALNAVRRGEADALVYDRVVLSHLLNDQPARGLALLAHGLGEFHYAFALAQQSPKREEVNGALLRATRSPAWEVTVRKIAGRGI